MKIYNQTDCAEHQDHNSKHLLNPGPMKTKSRMSNENRCWDCEVICCG